MPQNFPGNFSGYFPFSLKMSLATSTGYFLFIFAAPHFPIELITFSVTTKHNRETIQRVPHFVTFSDKDGKDHGKGSKDGNSQLAVPRLSVCADAQKVDRAKLAQTEVSQRRRQIHANRVNRGRVARQTTRSFQ